jgi:hypothetical protein
LALGGVCETNTRNDVNADVGRLGDGEGEGSREEEGCEKEEFGEGKHF